MEIPLGQRVAGSFERLVVDASLRGRVGDAPDILALPLLHMRKRFFLPVAVHGLRIASVL